jgi:hypothetical protein
MARTYPDGYVSPNGVPAGSGSLGSAGGVDADGSAQRHTADTVVARQNFGWVPPAASGSDPRGGAYIPIGPSSPGWRKPGAAVFTTGMQGRKR